MGKEFNDTDFVEPRKACELAVEFAVDEEVAVEEEVSCAKDKYLLSPERLASMKNRYPELFDGSYRHLQPHTIEEWEEYDRRTRSDIADGQFCSFEEFTKEMKEDFQWLYE